VWSCRPGTGEKQVDGVAESGFAGFQEVVQVQGGDPIANG